MSGGYSIPIAWPVRQLLPHSGPMVLLDRATDAGPDWAAAEVRIAEDTLFFERGRGVPAWIGIEYMAQTVAMFAGLAARRAGRAVPIGLLVGTRRYEATRPYFPLASLLTVRVQEEVVDGPLGVFDCTIADGALVARARLNVYVPPDQSQIHSVQP